MYTATNSKDLIIASTQDTLIVNSVATLPQKIAMRKIFDEIPSVNLN